jgi:hypothetical protein
MWWRLGLWLAVLPGLAAAECPTAADMARGVEIVFANGDVTVMRDLGAGMIEVEEYYSWHDEGRRYFAYLGLYVTDEGPMTWDGSQGEGAEVRTYYPLDVLEMPVPMAGLPDWEGELRRDIGTDLAEKPAYVVKFGAMEPVVIGGCTYDAVAVGESLRPGAEDQKDQYSWYLPELGAGFIVGWTVGRELQTTEAVAIRAVDGGH